MPNANIFAINRKIFCLDIVLSVINRIIYYSLDKLLRAQI